MVQRRPRKLKMNVKGKAVVKTEQKKKEHVGDNADEVSDARQPLCVAQIGK